MTAAGLPASRICGKGHTCSTYENALKLVRGKEVLEMAGGLRPLGSSRDEIVAAWSIARKAGKVIMDAETKLRSDVDGVEMLALALQKIRGERSIGDRASEMGKVGGPALAAKRAKSRCPDNKARTLWLDQSIPSNDAAVKRINKGYDTPWSASTLYRYFGKSGRPTGHPGNEE